MFWKRKRDTVEPASTQPAAPPPPRYWLDSETENYGLFLYAPGERIYVRDLQAIRDSGWRPIWIDAVRSEYAPAGVLCERIAP